ncbi:MAG: hypothetical protein AAF901_12075 [Bacteroidota bacterium]
MVILFLLIAYYLDYKYNKTTFFKALTNGMLVFIMLAVSGLLVVQLFDLHILFGVFCIGIEIILLFSIKAFIESRKRKP